MELDRRAFVRAGAGAVVGAVLSACSSVPRWGAPLVRFGLVTDLHFSRIPALGNRQYAQSAAKLERIVSAMNEARPDFMIELGDFKDLGPTKEETLSCLDEIEGVFHGFKGPRYHVLGNHDTDCLSKGEFLAHVDHAGHESTYYSFVQNAQPPKPISVPVDLTKGRHRLTFVPIGLFNVYGIEVGPQGREKCDEAALYLPIGLGCKVGLPADGRAKAPWKAEGDRLVMEPPRYPGPGYSMPWVALTDGGSCRYWQEAALDRQPLRFRIAYEPKTKEVQVTADRPLVAETLSGGWHAAAKRYRATWDRQYRLARQTEALRTMSGFLLVILKQQNGEVIWPYGDFAELADRCAERGLDWVGLFGWTRDGHDNRYPDYEPDEMI